MQKKMEEMFKEMAIQRKVGHEKKLEEVEEEEDETQQEVEQNGLKGKIGGWKNWQKKRDKLARKTLRTNIAIIT
jgi:hypothetical protein